MSPVDPSEVPEPSAEDLLRELSQLRLHKLRLEQREKHLLLALGEAAAQRLADLDRGLSIEGVALQEVMKRTLGSSARKPVMDSSKMAGAFVRKAPIKFQHPQDPSLVWSGRGKQPAWVRELEKRGQLDLARLTFADGQDERHSH